ncbi:hypothetical protein C7212DRAFT_340195 [Tuber magnatum]|uniref:Uncharacterized protein n=1 Tax=Tuber magnatum TaxID=42249 RepID=A0A317SY31_9PEZI|nr:hypothetical protein C7212DRAFT_340195 [Tuber magnatum]
MSISSGKPFDLSYLLVPTVPYLLPHPPIIYRQSGAEADEVKTRCGQKKLLSASLSPHHRDDADTLEFSIRLLVRVTSTRISLLERCVHARLFKLSCRMLHFNYCHLPELQTMRSVSSDYSLQAAIHHRYTLVFRLPTRLFSVIKRAKLCTHASPRAIKSSVSVPSTSNPTTASTKNPWVETVIPVKPGEVSDACAVPTGKEKSQHFAIPIRITVSGRLGSRLSTLLKSVGRCTPSVPSHLENDPLPFKQMSLAAGSSVYPLEFTRVKGCSDHTFPSALSNPLRHNDRPPEYAAVTPEPEGPGKCPGTPGWSAAAKARHNISLDTNPTACADTCRSIPDGRVAHVAGGTGPGLGVAPSPTLTFASSSAPTIGPTHEVKVREGSRQPVLESDFLHFYNTLEPYIIRHELASRSVERVPRPVDNGPLPESDGFRVLEGPFTTPAGGTGAPGVQEPPPTLPLLPTDCGVLREEELEVKRADPCLAPAIAASTDSISRQLVSRPVAPARLSDEMLGKAMAWDLDILHARTGFAQTLNSTLRSMQNRWLILEFDLAFGTGGASMFHDNCGFASRPLALQPPCLSPRITEIDDDENEPVLQKAAGEIQSYGGGASGSGSTQTRQASGSRAHFQKSGSTHLQRGKKRPSEDDDDDRKGKKKGRREEPPVGGDPPPPGSEGEKGVPCPYWVRDRNICGGRTSYTLVAHLGTINRHQRSAHPGQDEMEPIPRTTDYKLLRKNQALGAKKLTWEQIRDICFREEPEDPIPEPVMGLDGNDGFGSDGEEEEEGEELYDDGKDDDDEDQEDQENHDDPRAYEEHAERQGGHAGNFGAAVAVEGGRREDLIPPSRFEANRSMLSNVASTILDTPELLLADGEGPSFNPSEFPWSGPPPSPAPDHNSFHGQPPLSSPADGRIHWEEVEKYFSRKIEDFRVTCFASLRNRHGTSPRTVPEMHRVLQDIDGFLRHIGHSASVALSLPDGRSGPVAYCARGSFSYPVPPTSEGSIPLDLPMSQTLFQDPMGYPLGSGSTAPSLTHDSWSSHGSVPYGMIFEGFHPDGMPFTRPQPAVASGSQPRTSGMAGPQAGDNAIHDNFGYVLAHKSPKGDWSVGGDPLGMQPGFGPTHF